MLVRHKTKNPNESMFEVIIALLFLLPIAVIYFGMRTLLVCLFSVLVCYLFEMSGNLMFEKKLKAQNLSPAVTGLLIALALPAGVSLTLCFVAALMAILVAKFPFGGFGNNIFNPAATGLAFVAVSFKNNFFRYQLPLARAGEVSSSILHDMPHRSLEFEKLHLLIGNQPGPVGGVQILILIACLIFLCYHRTIQPKIVLACQATVATIAFLFPRAQGRFNSVFFELCSGLLLFASIFMATDPVTSPKFLKGQLVYGVTIGALTMLFRYQGNLEEGVIFAILIGNALTRSLDLVCIRRARIKRKIE